MDSQQLDRLAKLVGSGQSRRRILKTLTGGALGAVAAAIGFDASEAAARKRAQGAVCSKNADCASGACLPKDRTGRRLCGCASPMDCPQASDQCHAATCSAGVCGIAVNTGASCTAGDLCTTGETCQANGTCGGGNPVVCGTGKECVNGGCFTDCISDGACQSCGGSNCRCGAAEKLCQDTATGIGTCTTDADCPKGTLCSAYTNGVSYLCTQPCPGCIGA